MIEKIYDTPKGSIHYWLNQINDDYTLVFLPGLTADHRLFEKQLAYFDKKYNMLVWDAPGHYLSRPFILDFGIDDKARWLRAIFEKEKITKPVIIGQSMGGYVGQAFLELFPHGLEAFVSIDSAPLQREYISSFEIWLLERMEPVYKLYPWKTLIKAGSKGVATTEYGQNQMAEMMSSYDKDYYCKLVGHGYQLLAEAYKKDRAYKIDCPVLLLCGEKDRAGSAKNYNIRWAKKTGFKSIMIKDAGHNANADKPEETNKIIEDFLETLR